MIEITSLFLGFVVGLVPVEMAAADRVASVILRLDEREVARLETPPWTAEVDFGAALKPHRLEAVALDEAGRELERSSRLINYSRSDYEAVLILDPVPRDAAQGAARSRSPSRSGRVRWAAVLDQDPSRLELLFDGESLAATAEGRFLLPPYDAEASHYLEAVLTFPDGHNVRAELHFGGRYGDRVTSALTALPITSPAGRAWTTEEVRGWLERERETVPVFAARGEDGALLVVSDIRLGSKFRRLLRELDGRADLQGRAPARRSFEVTRVSPRPLRAHENTFQLRSLGLVRSRSELGAVLADGPSFDRARRKRKQQLWDGVALAGRHAAASHRPRAVALLLGDAVDDASVLSLPQAVQYLRSVRVPLFVWSAADESRARRELTRLELLPEERVYSGAAGLGTMLEAVLVEMASQTIVWLEGEYLPSEISLHAAVPEEVRLVR